MSSESREHPLAALTVRPALPAEYDAVADLLERGFINGPYGHLTVSAERRALVRDSAARAAAGVLLVAVDTSPTGVSRAHGEPLLVGTVSLLRSGTWASRLAVDGEAELRLLAVSLEYRGQGIGEALVRATFSVGSRWGADAIVLDTGAANIPAQRLYERMRFHRIAEREVAYRHSANEVPVAYRYPLN